MNLNDIRKSAERKYGDFPVELSDGSTVTLRNPLRLSKDERTDLKNVQSEMGGEEETDQVDSLERALLIVAGETAGRRLVDEINHDLTVLAEVFDQYGKATQAGEASRSED